MSSLFGKSAHTAFVVPDLQSAVARMLEAGIGPAFMLRRLITTGRYRGQLNKMLTNVAFLNAGGVQFEILEQLDDSPSIYREFLNKHPAGGLHHIAYYSANFDADRERARQSGLDLKIVQEFLNPDGSTFEIYMEPVNASNPLLVQFMYPATAGIFDEMARISAGWDRADPVRNLFDLIPPEIAAALPTAPE
jgi:catechol 2,3-dioxygenase-like lactoylglutathione lyase family enzyme